jgi:hypothetical protein
MAKSFVYSTNTLDFQTDRNLLQYIDITVYTGNNNINTVMEIEMEITLE